MSLLTFEVVDKILIELPQDVNGIIYEYYNDNHCLVCIKKGGCESCRFCVEHRTKSEYFCKCHCACSICCEDNWKGWYEDHYGIKLEPELETGVFDTMSNDLLNNICINLRSSLRQRRNGISSTPEPECIINLLNPNIEPTLNLIDLPDLTLDGSYLTEDPSE